MLFEPQLCYRCRSPIVTNKVTLARRKRVGYLPITEVHMKHSMINDQPTSQLIRVLQMEIWW